VHMESISKYYKSTINDKHFCVFIWPSRPPLLKYEEGRWHYIIFFSLLSEVDIVKFVFVYFCFVFV
jgi:hypothetical protein